jgi:hypothetical protein
MRFLVVFMILNGGIMLNICFPARCLRPLLPPELPVQEVLVELVANPETTVNRNLLLPGSQKQRT